MVSPVMPLWNERALELRESMTPPLILAAGKLPDKQDFSFGLMLGVSKSERSQDNWLTAPRGEIHA